MAERNFSRLVSIRIPFTATSGNVQFDMIAAGIPINPGGTIRDALSFAFVNETPFDVRLQGYADGQAWSPVKQDGKSWSVLARSDKGPFLSKKPVKVSVQAFSTPGNPFDASASFSGCFLELVYGVGQ